MNLFKKPLFVFVILLMAALAAKSNAQQSNPQLIFGKANKQLQQGHISRALALYHQLEKRNQISGALFLNMGLSYTRIDSMGMAEYYFLKARQFNETKHRAQKGLAHVQKTFSHRSATLPLLPWQRWLNWLEKHIGVDIIIAAGLILINIGVVLFIIPWFLARSRTVFPASAATLLIIGILIVLLGFYVNYRDHRYHKAVMINQVAEVNKKPSVKASLVSKAYEGYIFTVDRRKSSNHSDWKYIRMSNGQYGWISAKNIMVL